MDLTPWLLEAIAFRRRMPERLAPMMQIRMRGSSVSFYFFPARLLGVGIFPRKTNIFFLGKFRNFSAHPPSEGHGGAKKGPRSGCLESRFGIANIITSHSMNEAATML